VILRRFGTSFASVLLLSLLLTLVACGSEHRDESLLGTGSPSPSPSPSAARGASPPTTTRELLDQRAAALMSGDEKTFLAAVVRDDPPFLASQRRLFRNFRALPVSDLGFRADGPHAVRRSVRLAGFDTAPVRGPAGFAVERRAGRLVVVPAIGADQQPRDPWDLSTVRVLRRDRALLLYDDADASRANELIDTVDAGIGRVASVVPGDWSQRAVVYAFRDPAVLAAYSRVPGGSVDHLGALSFPVRTGSRVVGERVALLPTALDADATGLARVVRHELTHVALGVRDDDVPLWLTEGLAEYVAAAPIPPARQRIATLAVDRARDGFDGLPDTASFHDAEQDLHYSEAWMACDYLADAQGPGILWDLLDAMQQAGVGRDGRGQDAVLRVVTGLDGQALADKAARRTLRLFGPPTG
jgi:hypothetical protein